MRKEEFETICSFDPEIDTSRITADDYEEYLVARDDLNKVRHCFTPNGPTIYIIREIPHALWESYVDRGDTYEEKCRRAFCVGLKAAKNVYQADGTRLGSVVGSRTQNVNGRQVDMLDEKDLVYFSAAERLEIGGVAYAHSFLPRRIENCFRLPHTLLRSLAGRAYLSAGSSPISQEAPSAEPSAQEAT